MNQETTARLEACAKNVHRNIWGRFIGPDNVLYDYAPSRDL